jgi:hypothetical protein
MQYHNSTPLHMRCIANINTMTHVKNAEAFTRMVNFCTGYGGKYNPGRPTLQVDALAHQMKLASQALEQVITTKSHFDNVVNERRQVFAQLRRLAASVLRTLEASGASPEKLEDARSFASQVTGFVSRATVKTEEASVDTPPVTSKRSLRQMAYVSKADAFAKLLKAVATEPQYQVNEAHLAVKGLEERLEKLQALNQQVYAARTAWSNALIERNKVMYDQKESMLAVARAVRKYVRAIFGHDSQEYAQVKALRFTKPGTS